MEDVLAGLLREAGLPPAASTRPLTGRGLDNEVHAVDLADGRQVILRRWREARPRPRERTRAAFLEAHGMPAPRLLAESAAASLYELAPGILLGDLIEAGRADDATWRLVGRAYRRVHDVAFPAGLAGEVRPDRIVLRPVDPAAQMHRWIDRARPGLRRRAPAAVGQLPALHELVERAAGALRSATTALGHGDVNMWNVLVDAERAWLIDWDEPRVADPAMEVALLDKHAWLFNRRGVAPAFFDGYGRARAEPNTSLHRVVQAVRWAASGDWDSFERQPLPADLRERLRGWLDALLGYVAELPGHVESLRAVVAETAS
jgi:Ser/Thr protein kinase RdoA (MazF antagonist)